MKQRVTGSIPSLGHMPGLQTRSPAEATTRSMFLSLFLPPFLSLKVNKWNFKKKCFCRKVIPQPQNQESLYPKLFSVFLCISCILPNSPVPLSGSPFTILQLGSRCSVTALVRILKSRHLVATGYLRDCWLKIRNESMRIIWPGTWSPRLGNNCCYSGRHGRTGIVLFSVYSSWSPQAKKSTLGLNSSLVPRLLLACILI